MRPHLLDIDFHPNGAQSFRGTIAHINPAGPVVKIEVASEWGNTVQVNLTPERYNELALKKGMEVYISPKEMKAFLEG